MNLNLPPRIKYQMEEFKTIIFYRVQSLVVETLVGFYPITYAAKWDAFRTSMDTVMQNLKSFSSSFV